MFEWFGTSELGDKLADLERRHEELNRFVRVWGNDWCLAQHVYGNGGIWERLSALEERVYGHDGRTKPSQAAPVYQRLATLETTVNGADGHWGLSQHIFGTGHPGQEGIWKRLEQLEKENRELREQLQSLKDLDKVLTEAVNRQLGTIK